VIGLLLQILGGVVLGFRDEEDAGSIASYLKDMLMTTASVFLYTWTVACGLAFVVRICRVWLAPQRSIRAEVKDLESGGVYGIVQSKDGYRSRPSSKG